MNFCFLFVASVLITPEFSFASETFTRQNYRLMNSAFRTVHGYDWLTCILACEASSRCGSYNYKKPTISGGTALCELNNVGVQEQCKQPEKYLVYDEDFVFQQLKYEKTSVKYTCPAGFFGIRCEKKIPQSCKDYKENGANYSGIYSIHDANGTHLFVVYCDLTSEPHFTWTLVQSYSYANNALFTAQHMSYDFPVNEESLQWNQYRLSRANMQRIADQSTYVRFTCNLESDGLVYTDYARAKLDAFHIFKMWYSECRLYERLNIRGVECKDCTAASYQRKGTMFHIGTYDTGNCQFNATVGAVLHEQSFGRYNFPNLNFRCVSTQRSTTQTWFGVRD